MKGCTVSKYRCCTHTSRASLLLTEQEQLEAHDKYQRQLEDALDAKTVLALLPDVLLLC